MNYIKFNILIQGGLLANAHVKRIKMLGYNREAMANCFFIPIKRLIVLLIKNIVSVNHFMGNIFI